MAPITGAKAARILALVPVLTLAKPDATEGLRTDSARIAVDGGKRMRGIEADKAKLQQAYRDMIRTMLDRKTDALGALLDSGYVLTHMTGMRQSKADWLDAVATGRMLYHAARERSIEVEVNGDRAELVGRSVVEATIYGAHGTWNLQLVTQYVRRGGEWLATGTVASTF